jgi:hypothetical protein
MARRISLFSLMALLLCAQSWQPPSALTSDARPKLNRAAGEPHAGDQPGGSFLTGEARSGETGGLRVITAGVNAAPPAKVVGVQSGGTAFYSNGVYDCSGSSYSYHVNNGPPNTCGTLKLTRNGVFESTPNWICTDGSGNATKGPWTVSANQTGQNVRIEWPNTTTTTGGTTKVDDNSAPTISSNNRGPSAFDGTASDTQWGSGFGSWTDVRVTFRDVSNGLYWNGSCYCSSSPVTFFASFSPSGGFSISWSIVPPPSYAHDPFHTYQWCVVTKDRCSNSNTHCVIATTF